MVKYVLLHIKIKLNTLKIECSKYKNYYLFYDDLRHETVHIV